MRPPPHLPAPPDIEPGAYLRISEIWPELAWQAPENMQCGAGFGATDLGTFQTTPDGWDHSNPGRRLRTLSTQWQTVEDHDLHQRWLKWWRFHPERRAFIVPNPHKPDIWHTTAMPAQATELTGSCEGFWNRRSDRNHMNINWQENLG